MGYRPEGAEGVWVRVDDGSHISNLTVCRAKRVTRSDLSPAFKHRGLITLWLVWVPRVGEKERRREKERY